MKTKIFTLLLALAASVGTIFASSALVDGKWYDINSDDLTAKVTYRGSSYDLYTNEYSGIVVIPSTIYFNGNTYNVTSIGESAFRGCKGLTSVTIPNSVTSIENYAFYDCSGLTSVLIPNSVTSIGSSAFGNCSGLTSVTIGNSVTSIGEGAYERCTGLTSVTIPNSVTSIGDGAFSGCSGLTSVTIPHSVTSIGNRAFSGCSGLQSIKIPNSVISIGRYAFHGCSGLTSVTIPDSITSIGVGAFYGCSGLTSVTIPNSVTSIGWGAFYGCSGLTSIEIPNSVTSIGEYAFYNCRSLTSVTIPNSVTSIENGAFGGCSGLTSVAISNSVTSIGGSAFSGCRKLISVTIPNSVTSIGNSAFQNCSTLTSVTINSDSIINKTFSTSSNFKNIFGDQVTTYIIGDSVTGIGRYAFEDCGNLEFVSIGKNVTIIGSEAFYRCTCMTSVLMQAENPPTIGASVFSNNKLASIYVPCGAMDAYKSNWTTYASKIKYQSLPYTITTESQNGIVKIDPDELTICSDIILTAIPNENYHFSQWSDGNIDNPRAILLTQDTTFIAEFSNQFSINVSCDEIYGSIIGENGTFMYFSEHTYEAIPKYGYHFSQWSDGNKDNPRTIILTQDSILIAEFEKNSYSIVTESTNTEWGLAKSDKTGFYLDQLEISAIPNIGYHFVQWSDGNTNNPRLFELTQDTSFVATFAKNMYNVVASCDSEQGSIEGVNGDFEYLSENTYIATSNYGYHFDHWVDTVLYSINDALSSFEAYVLTAQLGNNEQTDDVYAIHGYITGTYRSYTNSYYISDTPDGEGKFIIFKANTSAKTGDHVLVVGHLYNYLGTTPETYAGASMQVISEEDTICTILISNYKNPRTIKVKNTLHTNAIFAKNTYTITKNANNGTISGNSTAKYLDEVLLTAIPNNYYHFTQWSDGNTDNPRTFVMTQDTTFIAEFEKNSYSVTTESANPEFGTTEGDKTALYLDEVEISASANYGYHFTQWSDGNTDNPRTIILTQDTSFTATFAKNTYSITSNATNGTISGNPTAEYMDEVILTATPDYGYHFIQWSDGNLDNPRTFVVTQDTSFTAEFAINQYEINVSCDEAKGSIVGESGSFDYLSTHTYQAIPNDRYHFKQWSDGNTDNPRTIVLTQDTALTAEFAPDIYVISTAINYPNRGSVSINEGNEAVLLMQASVMERTVTGSIPGSVSTNLSNGKTKLDEGTYFGVKFTPGSLREGDLFVIHITTSAGISGGPKLYETPNSDKLIYTYPENAKGIIGNLTIELPAGVDTLSSIYLYRDGYGWNPHFDEISIFRKGAEYLEEVTLTANSEYGYHFTQWSDGNTDNPRAFIITQDTTFTAEFAVDKSGTCGEDNQLTWTYDDETKTLTISGSGALTSNFTYGVEAPTQMQNLIIGNEVTAIGDSAFYEMSTINHLVIGGSVASIGDYAFAECKNFDDITCYATTVPTITENTFANVGNKQYIYLYVPEGRQRAYLRDTYWGEFDIQVKNAEAVTEPTEDVVVTPSENSVEIVWPIVTGAETYEIAITKDNQIVCTLTFNAQGLLAGIAFASAREMTKQQQAEGFRFTITGLTSNTQYGYSVVSKDASNNSLDTKSGLFTTTGIATGIDDISSSLQGGDKGRLILLNGQIFILRGGRVYDMTGQEVR